MGHFALRLSHVQFDVVTTACGMNCDTSLNYVVFNESQAHFLGYRNPSRRVLPAPIIGNIINTFIHNVETRELSEVEDADLAHVMRLCHLRAQLFEKETDKNVKYCTVLDGFLKSVLEEPAGKRKLPISSTSLLTSIATGDQTSTDDSTAVHVITVGDTGRVIFPVYIGERARYNGSESSCDPTVQLLYYYRRFVSKLPLRDTCLYPCLGLSVVDNIVIAGILYVLPPDESGKRFIAYSRVAAYVLGYLSASSRDFKRIVAFFTAMRDLIFNLRAYYYEAEDGIPHSLTVSDSLSGKLHVDPRPVYYSKLLFTGVVKERFGAVPEGVKHVMVKYVEFYGHRAHEAAARLGIVPALYAVENIASGMKVVVMEMLVGFTPLCQIDDALVRQAAVLAVMEASSALHAAGFVHGDLHAANVLVKDGSDGAEIRLVDFDWSGQCDVDIYPVVPNSSLDWHKDVARGKLLSAAHDKYACTALERYARDPEAEMEKQTVTPPRTPPKADAAVALAHTSAGETSSKPMVSLETVAGGGVIAAAATAPDETSIPSGKAGAAKGKDAATKPLES
jgi:hypothetical protein